MSDLTDDHKYLFPESEYLKADSECLKAEITRLEAEIIRLIDIGNELIAVNKQLSDNIAKE